MMISQWRMTVPIILLVLLLLVLPPSLPPIFFVTAYTIIRQHHHHNHLRQASLGCDVNVNALLQQQLQQLQHQQQHHRRRLVPCGTTSTQLCNGKDSNDYANYDGPGSTNNNNDDDDDDDDDEEDVCVGGGNSDEEECEIDWSKMPGFDDDAVPNDSSDDDVLQLRAQLERQFQMPSSTSSTVMETEDNNDNDNTLKETAPLLEEDMTIVSQSSSDFQRLEMIWQQREESTECDIYEPITCGGQTCTTCTGTGHTTCRFCRGTKFLYLPITQDVLLLDNDRNDDFDITQRPSKPTQPPSKNSSYISCSICHTTGTEVCRTCQGSGWIAHWTQLGVRVGDILK